MFDYSEYTSASLLKLLDKRSDKSIYLKNSNVIRIQGLFENPVSFSNREQFSQEIFEVLPDANMLNKKVTS